MSKGLYIKEKRDINIASIIFWLIFVGLFGVCVWYGYRFYTKGELPPVPLPASATANREVDESIVTQEAKDEHKVASTYPRYLSIENLNVSNARVHAMGITGTGELDTPMNIFDIGWHQESALPGEGGGALLMGGHNGGPTKDGVFKKLPDLKTGSSIVIERGDGKKLTYRTQRVEVVSLESLNNGGMKELTKSIDPSAQGLNIISCTGNWIPAQKTYDQRVVVQAALVQ